MAANSIAVLITERMRGSKPGARPCTNTFTDTRVRPYSDKDSADEVMICTRLKDAADPDIHVTIRDRSRTRKPIALAFPLEIDECQVAVGYGA
jgi:hypothetical protein